MICWILKTNMNTYEQLCMQEGIQPHIIEQDEDKVHVAMTANMANTWAMLGYWCELG